MLCLGIETSCDDTSLALVRDGRLLGQTTAGQTHLHALFGGVVPELASREHARLLGPLFDQLMAETETRPADLDVIAVARGPGLLGSLLTGVAFAKALALGTGAGLVGVNHLHAHLLAVGLERELLFPALGLLVSGGHTNVYRVGGLRDFQPLGGTLDDAAGEAFDKVGKLLGLPYPAGRCLDELANEGLPAARLFSRPRVSGYSFSFSGLKTAACQYLAARPELRAGWRAERPEPVLPEGEARARLADFCASFRLAVVDSLVSTVRRCLDAGEDGQSAGEPLLSVPEGEASAQSREQPRFSALMLAGGVAANSLLRKEMAALAAERGLPLLVPSPALCTDNGAMIAYLGQRLAEEGRRHGLDLEAIPRGRRVPDDLAGDAANRTSTLAGPAS